MKKNLFLAFAVLCATNQTTALLAQTLHVTTGDVTYAFPAAEAGEMTFTDGETLSIAGRTFVLADIARMYVDDSEVKANTVAVAYDGERATVAVAGNVAAYVEVSINGAHVAIKQADDVGDDTCGEITYTLTGNSADGSFTLEGIYKNTLKLQGLTLHSETGAPIVVENGKRTELSISEGTENTLSDCENGTQKGCIVCKGHLELKGKGHLTLTGHTAHAIYAKEYVTLKNCTIDILKAVKDGINCSQYFSMESGTLTIEGTGDDGIQTSYKDDTDREAEDTGTISILGGSIKASVGGTATKALKADGDVVVGGGTLELSTTGGSMWDAEEAKTKSASCISADGDVRIENGTLTLVSSGCGGKGISADGTLTIQGGTLHVFTSGSLFAYVNGTEYPNYTGNTDNLQSDYKSSPKGIKADGNVTIGGGVVRVSVKGYGGEGIESKGVLTIDGGTIEVSAYDDGLNASSHIYINGGDVTSLSSNNDGIDSNGNFYLNGGRVRTFGAGSMECGIDTNEEENYKVYFTGGELIAVGGQNAVPSTSTSGQSYVSSSSTVSAGSTISLTDGSGTLVSFEIPTNYKASTGTLEDLSMPTDALTRGGGNFPGGSRGGGAIVITCPGITKGATYTLVNGTSSSSTTAK